MKPRSIPPVRTTVFCLASKISVVHRFKTVTSANGDHESCPEGADLVDTVAQLPQLVNACSCLHVWVIARSDGSHAGWLVSCVALCAVLKVRVRAPRTVHAYVACQTAAAQVNDTRGLS